MHSVSVNSSHALAAGSIRSRWRFPLLALTAFWVGFTACGTDPGSTPSPTPGAGTDQDKDGVTVSAGDCDDTNAAVYPGADELCDGIDNNCNGELDGPSAIDAEAYYLDSDQDLFGDEEQVLVACENPAGYAPVAGDCDNFDPTINPGAAELCDGIDNNCNGELDGASSADATTFFADLDRDGYGDEDETFVGCQAPSGYISTGGDCNDTNASIHPDQPETCDGFDNNCDGSTDDSDAIDARVWYRDKDEDGYGIATNVTTACTQPSGYTAQGGDCNDQNNTIYPGQTEVVNGVDDDCDGIADDGTAAYDDDKDGYSENQGDCNDSNASISPTGTDGPTCDLIDQDCDGRADDNLACNDDDGDGFSELAGDCNDYNFAIHPGQYDNACDGIDADCNGSDGVGGCNDVDQDGYASDAGDCNDQDNAVYPGAPEVFDGRDQDCDGFNDEGAIPPGTVIIHELQMNPATMDDKQGEWFELYNTSALAIDLYGWSFQDNYTSVPAYFVVVESHVTLVTGGLVILGNCGDPAQNGGLYLDYAYYGDSTGDGICDGGNLQLANSPSVGTPEKLSLFDPAGVLIDTVTISDTIASGQSKQLDLRGRAQYGATLDDASTSIYWCEATATPQSPNAACF